LSDPRPPIIVARRLDTAPEWPEIVELCDGCGEQVALTQEDQDFMARCLADRHYWPAIYCRACDANEIGPYFQARDADPQDPAPATP